MAGWPDDVFAALHAFYLTNRSSGELSGGADSDGLRATAWSACSRRAAWIHRDVGDERE